MLFVVVMLTFSEIVDAKNSEMKLWPILPNLKLSATTSGSANFEVGAGFHIAGKENVFVITPKFVLTTNQGIATLFDWNQNNFNAIAPWEIGLTLGYSKRTNEDITGEVAHFYMPQWTANYDSCEKNCQETVPERNKSFCEVREKKLIEIARSSEEKLGFYTGEILADKLVCAYYKKKAIKSFKATLKKMRESPGPSVDRTPLHKEIVSYWQQCLNLCSENNIQSEDKVWCYDYEKQKRPVLIQATSNEACSAQIKREKENLFLYPPFSINAGFLASRSSFKYMGEMGDSDIYTEMSEKQTSWKFGVSFASVVYNNEDDPDKLSNHRLKLTLEGLVVTSIPWKASSNKVHWCVPSATVNPTGNAGESTVTSQVCKDSILGPPKGGDWSVDAKFLVGGVDTIRGFWRFAFGPMYSWDALTKKYSLGLELPIFLNFITTKKVEGRYHGLLRVAPSVEIFPEADEGDPSWQVLLRLSLLGQRSMFSPDFDSL